MDEIIQGSPEWKALRLGHVTASRVADIVAKTKSGYSTSRANYMAQLICERLTGNVEETYTNAAMQWGIDKEPEARIAYEFMRDCEVVQAAFVTHPTICLAGASPDGLVGDDGLVEIKAPLTATHFDTLLNQAIPERYCTQMYWQMACTGRQWCDYVSFDPRVPEHMRLFVKRLERNDTRVAELEQEVKVFQAELDAKIAALNALFQ